MSGAGCGRLGSVRIGIVRPHPNIRVPTAKKTAVVSFVSRCVRARLWLAFLAQICAIGNCMLGRLSMYLCRCCAHGAGEALSCGFTCNK